MRKLGQEHGKNKFEYIVCKSVHFVVLIELIDIH